MWYVCVWGVCMLDMLAAVLRDTCCLGGEGQTLSQSWLRKLNICHAERGAKYLSENNYV